MFGYFKYLRNCLWLWTPPLAISLALWSQLGPAYQPAMFWQDIPPLLAGAENLSRGALIAMSSVLAMQFKTRRHRVGLAIYLFGLVLYLTSYVLLIAAPEGSWSLSFVGFVAPAVTPLVWIIGIGLIGDQSFLTNKPWPAWIFFALAAGFLVSHIAHTSLIYFRGT